MVAVLRHQNPIVNSQPHMHDADGFIYVIGAIRTRAAGVYSRPTRVDEKYEYFSVLWQQMDEFPEGFDIIRCADIIIKSLYLYT